MPSSVALPDAPSFVNAASASDTTSLGLSTALTRDESPSIPQWTCPCLNVRLSLVPGSIPAASTAFSTDRSPWLAELVSDNGIHIQFSTLISRETVSLAANNNITCATCLNCDTVVYAASRPAPPGPARALGFETSTSSDAPRGSIGPVSPNAAKQYRSPSREPAGRSDRIEPRANESAVVRPLDRKVWIFPDALSPRQASDAAGSKAFSPAFNVLIARKGADEQEAGATNSASYLVNARDATPTRPSVGPNRTSSYAAGTGAGNITYALPAIPQHLITTPPASPRTGGPAPSTTMSSALAPTSLGSVTSPGSSAPASSSNPTSAADPLAAQLDSVAIERLKELRAKAEAEVFELVRQKRREMEQLEKRFRDEAETLLTLTKTPRQTKSSSSNASTASLVQKVLREQSQRPSEPLGVSQRANTGLAAKGTAVSTPSGTPTATHARSDISAAPLNIGTVPSSTTSRRESLPDEYSDLPPSAFERRPTYTNSSNGVASMTNANAPAAVASSLGGLSASFAMRGRELPLQMQDWAEKRRLRERYPQGDHSVLPSAANSNVNSAANSIGDSEEDAWLAWNAFNEAEQRRTARDSNTDADDDVEMDRRGRGRQPSRQRGGSSSREPREPRQDQDEPQEQQPQKPSDRTVRGRPGRAPAGVYNPPPAMSSSLLTKRPAIAYVDDGRDADETTPSVGGKLISPRSVAEPSAQVTLRPRDPPPSTAEPLKPATRSSAVVGEKFPKVRTSGVDASPSVTESTDARSRDSPRLPKASEKKVAFAETEDRVDHTIDSDEYDDDEGDEGRKEFGSAQRSHNGPSSVRTSVARPALVDESADAVFEIDEETQDSEFNEDGAAEETPLSPEDSERHKVEMSQSGLRTGASGRPRGQADDILPGFEDDAVEQTHTRRGLSSGSLSDDFRSSSSDDDEEAVPPGFGAASFSALAASQTAMYTLASSMARARADDSGFDPASLRMDGRVVVPPPSVSSRDLEAEPELFVVGSLRSSARRTSVQLPSGTLASSRQGQEAGEGVQSQVTGSNISVSARHQRSSSRTRVSNMSKEDADTEVRLSGLLAPNAPSHRSLWSPKEAKARRAGKHKFKLDDEDNQKWDLWKRKVGSGDAGTSPSDPEDSEGKSNARSTPVAVAPPTQFIAAGSGIGPRPLREATMIDPDYSTSINTFTAFDRHLQARAAAAAASDQAADTGSGGVSIGKRTWGYGSFKDDTSGFETEPKTSLPYKEKMMVPSLRKALRKSIFEPAPQKKLDTIPDADDAATSVSGGGSIARSAVSAKPLDGDLHGHAEAQASSPALKDADHKGALPGSLVTRGFHMPGSSGAGQTTSQPETVKPVAVAAASAPTMPATAAGLGIPSIATSSRSTVERSEKSTRDAAAGPSLPGSGAATPSSLGRRSPRPPYVAPPPPESATTVLVSDPAQHPRALELFKTPADTTFRLHEDDEEDETEEGWRKVLKFMHVIEQLKTNKRTGWLHHRIPAPESIADHMYRMALLSLLCPAEADVDLGKCVQLAIVHDLAEAEVGDLTPLDGVDKHEKARREKEAIQYFVHDLLGSNAAGLRIEALWEEYEARETKESKLVKDLDRFELSLQAIEYERRYGIDDLQAFWEGSIPHVGHPRIRRWALELARERAELWQARQRGYEQQ